jgi:NAD(P)-dependent dehydrogenase (short-subunit alcohol dehydrogenase family)
MLSLVTGVGARGQVGEAVAAGLAARGDTLIVVSRDAGEVQDRARELSTGGREAFGYACDLADPAAVDALASHVRSRHGDRLDALVNLAGGWASSGPLADSDPMLFDRMLRINLHTAYLATRAFLPLLANARGSVVFFASEIVLDGTRSAGVAGYSAAKAGVVAVMRSVADEGRELGIRSNALAPASIRTGTNTATMGERTRFVEREEVAAAVAFLTSPEASAISSQVIRLRPKA